MFKLLRRRATTEKKEKQKARETQAETVRETEEDRAQDVMQNPSSSFERLLNGEEVVVSFPDLRPVDLCPSSCGLAALNAARVILWQNAQLKRLRDDELLLELMEKRTLEDIADICSLWKSDEYLDVEELCQHPEFQETLRLQSTHFGIPGQREFEDLLLNALQNLQTCCVLIITRTPETVACFRLVNAEGLEIFVIFDLYRRSDHPHGAGLIFSLFVESTAQRLAELLVVDPDLDRSEDVPWRHQIFTNYTAHLFVANTEEETPEEENPAEGPSPESNPELLALRSEMDNSATEISLLKTEIERLKNQTRASELDSHTITITALAAENGFLRSTLDTVRQQLREERNRFVHDLEVVREENRRLKARLVRNAEEPRLLPDPPDQAQPGRSENVLLIDFSEPEREGQGQQSAFDITGVKSMPSQHANGNTSSEPPTPLSAISSTVSLRFVEEDQTQLPQNSRSEGNIRANLFSDRNPFKRLSVSVHPNQLPSNSSSSSHTSLPRSPFPIHPISGSSSATLQQILAPESLSVYRSLQTSSSTTTHPAHRGSDLSPTYHIHTSSSSYQRNAASPVPSVTVEDSLTGGVHGVRAGTSTRRMRVLPGLNDELGELERSQTQPGRSSRLSGVSSTDETALQHIPQTIEMFECGICLEDHPIDFVAAISRCEHRYCYQCLREFVVSKLEEHRYPIVCPVCSTEADNEDPGLITNELVRLVGISGQHYEAYVELQVGTVSVLAQCRGCRRSAYIDRDDYDDANILTCPLPDCSHSWCKACQQPVPEDGEGHSCDGALEFDRLLLQKGWKRCPGCQTPVQKNEGCNHITCVTSGCNAHFCYQCGALITQSTAVARIRSEVSEHFTRCDLH